MKKIFLLLLPIMAAGLVSCVATTTTKGPEVILENVKMADAKKQLIYDVQEHNIIHTKTEGNTLTFDEHSLDTYMVSRMVFHFEQLEKGIRLSWSCYNVYQPGASEQAFETNGDPDCAKVGDTLNGLKRAHKW